MTEQVAELPVALVVRRKRDGRCVYSREAKQALVEIAMRPGVSVSRLARQHDLNANVLRKWIADALGDGKPAAARGDTGSLVPVKLAERPAARAKPTRSSDSSLIEIEVDGATIRVHGLVDAAQLRLVLDCARRR